MWNLISKWKIEQNPSNIAEREPQQSRRWAVGTERLMPFYFSVSFLCCCWEVTKDALSIVSLGKGSMGTTH